jgi:hypothetical protein
VDEGVNGPASSQIATNYQSELGASSKSPLAIGLGYGRWWKDTEFNLAVEWFAAVPRFTIIPAQPFTPQTGGSAIPMELTAQYRSLVNWGVGVQHRFSPQWNLYGAFRTDNTSIPTGVKSVGTLIDWNLMQANIGVQATIGRAAIILGLDTAWGGQVVLPTVDESYFNITGAVGFKFTY